ncbi:MAG: hypothetical protein M1827_006864 [Pycnora praestabilis]|nr:MAG: hypothetical protein M1827_006864 [Pycnora praestabilis]
MTITPSPAVTDIALPVLEQAPPNCSSIVVHIIILLGALIVLDLLLLEIINGLIDEKLEAPLEQITELKDVVQVMLDVVREDSIEDLLVLANEYVADAPGRLTRHKIHSSSTMVSGNEADTLLGSDAGQYLDSDFDTDPDTHWWTGSDSESDSDSDSGSDSESESDFNYLDDQHLQPPKVFPSFRTVSDAESGTHLLSDADYYDFFEVGGKSIFHEYPQIPNRDYIIDIPEEHISDDSESKDEPSSNSVELSYNDFRFLCSEDCKKKLPELAKRFDSTLSSNEITTGRDSDEVSEVSF